MAPQKPIPNQFITQVINALVDNPPDFWGPHSVTSHKDGGATYKCAGVTAFLKPAPNFAVSLQLYTPNHLSKSYLAIADNVEEARLLISAHISLRSMLKDNLLSQTEYTCMARSITVIDTEQPYTYPINPDWGDRTDIKSLVEAHTNKLKDQETAREKVLAARTTKRYQLAEAGLELDEDMSIEIGNIGVQVRQRGDNKWIVEIFNASDSEDSPIIEQENLAQLVDMLDILKTTLNAPFMPKGLEQDHKEAGDIELY